MSGLRSLNLEFYKATPKTTYGNSNFFSGVVLNHGLAHRGRKAGKIQSSRAPDRELAFNDAVHNRSFVYRQNGFT